MISSKLPNVGTTIFTTMSQLAVQTGALNLSQGFPDFNGPQALLDAVGRHISAGHNQYSPMTGLPALRQQVVAKIARNYGARVDADSEVTITPGATAAIFCAIHAVIRPGDEVIVFDPCYDSYEPAVELAGGRCVHVQLTADTFALDWQKLSDALSPRTRMIVINSPHNPSGALISRDELDQLAAQHLRAFAVRRGLREDILGIHREQPADPRAAVKHLGAEAVGVAQLFAQNGF